MTATQYQTAITNLTTGAWLGPTSAHMASAAEPYIAWLQSTAAEAAQTGAQAKAAAAAYQTAYVSMVPPPVITANRAELTTLVANNFLGQNTGAIAQNEAEYLDMWIQDALGMDTYQLNSTGASARAARADGCTDGDQWTQAPAAAVAAAGAGPTSGADLYLTALLEGHCELVRRARATSALGHDLGRFRRAGSRRRLRPQSPPTPLPRCFRSRRTYYMGMLGSTPARMFMSGGSGGSRRRRQRGHAGRHEGLAAGQRRQAGRRQGRQRVMSGVGGQLSSSGVRESRPASRPQTANALHAGGLSVPHGWHTGGPGHEPRGPVAARRPASPRPSMTTGLPSSPFSQGLMGALAGRGMSAMGSTCRRQGDAAFASRRLDSLQPTTN